MYATTIFSLKHKYVKKKKKKVDIYKLEMLRDRLI